MPESVIFYSWQSDLPAEQNRSLILGALETAALAIRADGSLKVEPVVDRDTEGVPGSPDIAATIFEKIAACDVFVCDVSIIGRSAGGRPTPNPNVLIELGYAIKSRGWGRVLMLMNEAHGGPTELPFDLRAKRVVTYRADGDATMLPSNEENLGRDLHAALSLFYKGGLRAIVEDEPLPSPEDTTWMTANSNQAFVAFRTMGFGISKEVFATLSPKPPTRPQLELLSAADGAQVKTFGCPIGVMDRFAPHMKPKPTSDGIVMATHSDRALFAYWALRGDGTFYLLKSLFEETKGQRQTLFFDTRVLRVTEVCMYLSRLYSRMGIPNESRLYLQLRFGGLKGALLKATDSRPFFHEQGPSAEDAVSTQVTTTLDALRENMPEVVKELTRPLFVLFDYYKLEDDNYRGIVENYQNGRIW